MRGFYSDRVASGMAREARVAATRKAWRKSSPWTRAVCMAIKSAFFRFSSGRTGR